MSKKRMSVAAASSQAGHSIASAAGAAVPAKVWNGTRVIGLLDASQFVQVAVGERRASEAADEIGGRGDDAVETVRRAARPRRPRQQVAAGAGARRGRADVAGVDGVQIVEGQDVEPVDRRNGDDARFGPQVEPAPRVRGVVVRGDDVGVDRCEWFRVVPVVPEAARVAGIVRVDGLLVQRAVVLDHGVAEGVRVAGDGADIRRQAAHAQTLAVACQDRKNASACAPHTRRCADARG